LKPAFFVIENLLIVFSGLQGKKPNTSVALTALGRKRIARHWEQLDRLKSLAQTPQA